MSKKNLDKFGKKIASAIFENAREIAVTELDNIDSAIQALAKEISGSEEMRFALNNPAINKKNKNEILSALCSELQAVTNLGTESRRILDNMLAIVVEASACTQFENISKHFSALLKALKRLASVSIESAFAYSEDEQAKFKDLLTSSFGLTPDITWQVNPELIGGAVVKVNDQVLDSSVRGALKNLKEALL